MTPKIIDKEEKKHAIITAALGVFARQGYGNTRMEEIARAAGIGKGTIYEYFATKDSLFFAIYEHVLNLFHEAIYRDASQQKSPARALENLIVATLRAFDEWREFSFVLLDFWSEHRRGAATNLRFSDIYAFSRQKIAGLIRKGQASGEFRAVDPLVAASSIIAVLDGLLLQRVFDPQTLAGKNAERTVAGILLTGLRR